MKRHEFAFLSSNACGLCRHRHSCSPAQILLSSARSIRRIGRVGDVRSLPPPPPTRRRRSRSTLVPGTTVEIAVPPPKLDEKDEIAALERIQYALSEVGDGKTYVWRRWHGRLSGIVQPTASFKDTGGKVCRHLIVLMTTRHQHQEARRNRLPAAEWPLAARRLKRRAPLPASTSAKGRPQRPAFSCSSCRNGRIWTQQSICVGCAPNGPGDN